MNNETITSQEQSSDSINDVSLTESLLRVPQLSTVLKVLTSPHTAKAFGILGVITTVVIPDQGIVYHPN